MASKKKYKGESKRAYDRRSKLKGVARKKANKRAKRAYKKPRG